jgi:APA family basic amino acid/polyamine antiporter
VDRSGARPEAQGGIAGRTLGPFDATMVVLGGIVGVGIFFTPSQVAERVPQGAWVLAAWAAGGAVALLGALTFASLAHRVPRAGGTYAFLRAGFGPFPAFLYAWASLLTINTGAMAIISRIAAENLLRLRGGEPSEAAVQWLAVLAIAVLTLVNALGLRQGAWTQNVLTALKALAIAGLTVLGFFAAAGGAMRVETGVPPPPPVPPAGGSLASGFCLALLPILFSYGGWQNACNLAEEVRSPRRNVPLAVVLGTACAAGLYLLFNAALLRQLGVEGMARSGAVGVDMARQVLPAWGATLASAAIATSALGVLNGFIFGAPRILYACARDGLVWRSFARLDPRTGIPLRVVLLQSALSLVYVFIAGLREIVDGLVVVDWTFFALAGLSWFALAERRLRLTALVPGLFALLSLAIVAGAFVQSFYFTADHKTAHMGLVQIGVLGVGALVYFVWRGAAGPPRTALPRTDK